MEKRRTLLGRRNQASIATIAFAALGYLFYSWLANQLGSGLVEIDKAPLLDAPFQADINQAEWTELIQLPDIGETFARRIVDERQLNGPFKSHEDLGRVNGIGEKTLGKIRPYLRPIEPAQPP